MNTTKFSVLHTSTTSTLRRELKELTPKSQNRRYKKWLESLKELLVCEYYYFLLASTSLALAMHNNIVVY